MTCRVSDGVGIGSEVEVVDVFEVFEVEAFGVLGLGRPELSESRLVPSFSSPSSFEAITSAPAPT